mgnify:FL=1|jgi:hypothetical protein
MNRRSYVMANIALPIEVTANNDYKLIKDRIKIDFGFCADLPGPTSAQDMEVVRRLFPSWSSSRRSPSPSPEPSPRVSRSPSPISMGSVEEKPPINTRSPSHSPPRTRQPEQPEQSTQSKSPEESARALFLALSQKDKTHKHKNRMTFRKYPAKPKQKYSRRVYD